MQLSILAAVVASHGHTVRVQCKPDELKVFPAGNTNYFISVPGIGPTAWEKVGKEDKDLKRVVIGGTALKEKGLSLQHDAITTGPVKKNGELQYSTWPMQIVVGHKDAEAALKLAFRNMLGIKEEEKPARTPEQEAELLEAAQSLMAG